MRDSVGYVLGFLIFVAGIPGMMWFVSGRPLSYCPSVLLFIFSIVFDVVGLALSIWSIVHMKKVGEGNPFDAYNHEVAPRTKHLMTDGPYRICRNPMLLGIYIFDVGVLLWLLSWKSVIVFALQVVFLTLQVRAEEKRLEADFGEEYIAYKKSTSRYGIPFNFSNFSKADEEGKKSE